LPGQRVFSERIRRGDALRDATPELRLQAGDVVVVSGRREVLVEIIGQAAAEEVEDREALDVPTAAYDVFVTSKAFAGKTLEEIARSAEPVRSVFLRGVSRRGQEIPVGPRTTIERADVLRLIGPEHAVAKVAAMAGQVVRPTDSTDFVALARACGLGVTSRLGLLLHRDFGPWWSVRALALTRLELPATGHASAAEPGFDPCNGCSAPCESACPGAAIGVAGFDVARCASQRLRSEACAVGCAARRACPVGGAHALRREDESVYAAASLAWIRAGAQAASR